MMWIIGSFCVSWLRACGKNCRKRKRRNRISELIAVSVRKLVEACLQKLKSDMKPGFKVKITLDSAIGKEPFYKKFGFKVHPNEDAGPGMDQRIIKE